MASRGEAIELAEHSVGSSSPRPMDSKTSAVQVNNTSGSKSTGLGGLLLDLMMFAMFNGGPEVMAWATLIAWLGAMAQAASIAEMSSCVPIAGAQYHWTNALASPDMRKFTTWLQGWITWFGWVSVLAAYVNLNAIVIEAMAALKNPNYIPKDWHTAVIMLGFLVFCGGVNSMRWTFVAVPWLELIAGILHVSLFILFIVVLVVMGSRNSVDDIFFHREIWSGWDSNPVLSWHLGMLTCVGSFISLDGTVHLAEETRLANKAVPRAVFWGVVVNGALGFAMVIVVLSAMGPFDEELAFAPYPMAVVLMRVTKSADAATAMLCGILIVFTCASLAGVASVSRLTWAWARDGGLPKWFGIVDEKHLLPVRAIWLGLSINAVLALINIGSHAAYGAILSLATITLFCSYGLAFLSMLSARYRSARGIQPLELGEWNMGKIGVYVNIFALLYTAYMIVFLPIPYSLPVTGATMNYAGPIFGFVLIFIFSTWFLWAKKKWSGVNPEIVDWVKEHADADTDKRII